MKIDTSILKDFAKNIWEFNELIAVISYDGKKLIRELKCLKDKIIPERKDQAKRIPSQDLVK